MFKQLGLLVIFTFVSCKSRSHGVANTGSLQSLDASDIAAITSGKKIMDSNRKKLLVFFEAEDRLTDGGASFIQEYTDLMRNNLGTNYEIYLVSSAKQESNWFYKYQLAVDRGAEESPVKAAVRYVRRGGTEADLTDLVAKINADIKSYKADAAEGEEREVEVLFHFLAHGLATKGGGEGLVGLASEQTLSWRNLADKVVNPIAESADELILVLESCFGGSLLTHLPQGFFLKNNAMLIFGAPAWASQAAPSGERLDENLNKSELAKLFTSSVATMAIKLALTGYASEGYIKDSANESLTNKNAPAPEDPVKFDNKEVRIFKNMALKEKHVVRVNEFVKYVQDKGKSLNCQIYRTLRSGGIKRMCSGQKLKDYGLGIYDTTSSVAVDLSSIARMTKPSFKKFAEKNYTLPPVVIKYPDSEEASLNPNGKLPNGNKILSIVNLQIFSDSQAADSNYQKFIALDKQGLNGITDEIDSCTKALDQINEDLWTVAQWLYKDDGKDFAPPPFLPPSIPKSAQGSNPDQKEDEPVGTVAADYSNSSSPLSTSVPTPRPKICEAY